MTLRRKTVLIIAITLVGLMLAMSATLRTLIGGGFDRTEEEAMKENVERVVAVYDQALDSLDRIASNWGNWDDSYRFTADSNAAFVKANCNKETLANLKLNALVILDRSGHVVFGTGFDLKAGRMAPVPASLLAELAPRGKIMSENAAGRSLKGIVPLADGPMLICAHPILTSKAQGTPRGTLLFGYYLNDAVADRLSDLSRRDLDFYPFGDPSLPTRLRRLADQPPGVGTPVLTEPHSEEWTDGYSLLRDIYGRPCLVMDVGLPRSIHLEGQALLHYVTLALLGVALVFGLVTLLFLERGVLSRLALVSRSVAAIGHSGDLAGRVAVRGADELASLAESVNAMLTSLERSQDRLRSSEERFRSVAQTASDAILSADSEGRIIFWNHAAEEIFGYTAEEAIGRPMAMLLPEQCRQAYLEAMARVVTTGRSAIIGQRSELTGLRKDALEFAMELSLASWKTGEGTFFTGLVRDITERKEAEERLRFLSLHDSLTGLYSRGYFEQEMRRLETGRPSRVGIIICDVDGLKLVNDTLGHNTGDTLLIAAAAAVRDSFREADMVARIGGDEFAVLLPGGDRASVEALAQRIRLNVARYNGANLELPLSMSIGFAASEEGSANLADLFKEADNAMYREKLHRSQSARSAIVQTLMKALEARDFITEGHADRLQELVAGVSKAIGLTERTVSDLRLLAQFHDIGKVGIPDRILFKPGPLNPEERVEMRRHCEIGYRIAQSAPDLVPIADWILKHHEAWDGSGYPLGLQGKDVPLECRILAIADAYDAMTNDRPYRKALPHEAAVAEIERCSGRQFDPQLVPRFIEVAERRHAAGPPVLAIPAEPPKLAAV